MSQMEEKLGAILGNPQMMQQIMSMAQAMEQTAPPQAPPPTSPTPAPDPAMIQTIANLAGQAGIDGNQQNLLQALSPYISKQRAVKLEKAMRAAKMARMASGFLNSGGLQMLTGR